MPAKRNGWFKGEVNLGLILAVIIWIVSAGVAYGVWTTRAQEQERRQTDFEITTTKKFETVLTAIETTKNKAADIGRTDDAARNRVRDEFLKAQEVMNQGIATLNTKLAVAETRYEQMVATLNKISDQIGTVMQGQNQAAPNGKYRTR